MSKQTDENCEQFVRGRPANILYWIYTSFAGVLSLTDKVSLFPNKLALTV